MLKAILGGSFGYFQAGAVGLLAISIIWLWRDYQGAKDDVTRLNGEVVELQGQVKSKDGVIQSMANTASRREARDTESKGITNDILQAKDGTQCASSEPLRVALDGLRDTLQRPAANGADETIPVLAGAYPASADKRDER